MVIEWEMQKIKPSTGKEYRARVSKKHRAIIRRYERKIDRLLHAMFPNGKFVTVTKTDTGI